MKKIIALILALSLCLSLTGCGTAGKTLGGKSGISYEKTDYDTPGSVNMSAELKATVDTGKLPLSISFTAEGRITREPRASCWVLNAKAVMVKLHHEIYTEERDGKKYIYTNQEKDGKSQWTTETTGVGTLDFTLEDLPELVRQLTDMEKVGTGKTASGISGDLYEGTINAQRIREGMEYLISIEPAMDTEEVRKMLQDSLKDMDPNVNQKVQIIMKDGRVLEIYLDFLPLYQKMTAEEQPENTFSENDLRISFWNYDTAAPITIPEAAGK